MSSLFKVLAAYPTSKWMVVVPGKSVGRVIGKAGAGLKAVEASTLSHVSIITDRGVDPTVVAFGGSDESCEQAALRVLVVLDPSNDSGASTVTALQFPLYDISPSTLTSLVDGSVSKVTGIEFEVEEGAIRIGGTLSAVVTALVIVRRDLIHSSGAKAMSVCTVQVYPGEIGGVIGKSGANIRHIEEQTGCFLVIPPLERGSSAPIPVLIVSINGDGESSVKKALSGIEGFVNQRLNNAFVSMSVSASSLSPEEILRRSREQFLTTIERCGCTATQLTENIQSSPAEYFSQVRRSLYARAESGKVGDVGSTVRWLREMVTVLDSREPAESKPISEALFFPSDANLNRMVEFLDRAKVTLLICVFNLTNNSLANAILDAHRRGVKIRVVSDDECARNPGSDISRLSSAGIPVALDASKFLMHHKFAVIDSAILMTGSFNWTRGASVENKENVLITNDGQLADLYTMEFERLWKEFQGNRFH